MSKTIFTVTIVVGPNTLGEADTIRKVLEAFNVRVIKYHIGKPQDFINLLNGEEYPLKSEFVVLCFHGVKGKFLMPKLRGSIYSEDEPREDFGPSEILEHFELKGVNILTTACSMGYDKIAEAFLEKGANSYIGAIDDINGDSSLFFTLRFFYEICHNGKTLDEAFILATSTDDDLGLFKLFK